MGRGISAFGLRRALLLQPTIVAVEVRVGSGDGEVEAAGVLRTAIMLEDSDLGSEEDCRGIIWRTRRAMEIYSVDRVARNVSEEKRC